MVKQVIVIRKDLKMRRGKEIAQGAHASMMFMSLALRTLLDPYNEVPADRLISKAQREWLEGLFTKVCVRVADEDALLEIEKKALKAGLECHVVTDAGLTEFKGVPTKTCLAIGPDEAEKIDQVTGGLSLY